MAPSTRQDTHWQPQCNHSNKHEHQNTKEKNESCRDGVEINAFGVFLVLVYPGAYVDLHHDDLVALPSARQLRIYTAGAWHNVVIVVCALGALTALPLLLTPLYATHQGAVVVDVQDNSPFHQVLHAHETITAVVVNSDVCTVASVADWHACLHHQLSPLAHETAIGHCVPSSFLVRSNSTGQFLRVFESWMEGV